MNANDAYKKGQQYGAQHPHAQTATSSQIPDYNTRIAFNNGLKSTRN